MGATRAEASGQNFGRYVLHGELASGGMATVHLGRLRGPVGFARTVAIKKLHPQFAKDPEFVNMFLDEARLAARVRHPNVVPTLDVVATGGEILLVMEYLPGESLSRIIRAVQKAKGRIPPRIAATIVAGALHGLHAAHEATNERGEPLGIVHRDVSPQNILVGVDGVAHVLDFGVAKAAGRVSTTREGQLKGKLAYMAPEQLGAAPVTRQSDVYAAAVVLWETLTLQRLYDGDNEAAVLVKVIEGRIEKPSNVAPGIPPSLDAVVLRGLAKNPAARYATAREMALALERAAGVVAPSELGEWVSEIARDDLATRARRVADIERRCAASAFDSDHELYSGVKETALPDPPVAAPLDGSPDATSSIRRIRASDLAARAEDFPELRDDTERVAPVRVARPRLLALAAVLLVGASAGVTAGLVSHGGARGEHAAPAPLASTRGADVGTPVGSAASADAPHAEASAEPPSDAPAATPPDEPAPATTGTATLATAAPAASPAPPAVKTRPAPRPLARPTAKPPSECDPPFTRDSVGHKHYKLNCL